MRRLTPALAVAIVAALILAACGSSDNSSSSSNASSGGGKATASCGGSVGIMAPITGDAAQQGGEQLHFAQLAIDQFNAKNGTTFTGVQGDTQLDPGQASTVAQQFVSNSKILAVVGPAGSQEVEAVGPVFTRAKLANVSPSATSTDLTAGKYPGFFRVVPTDAVQGPTDANYMADTLGAKKVFIVDDQTSYSTGLADSATTALKAKGVAVDRQSVNQKSTDFSSLVSKISADTQVVFLPWQLAANAQLFGNQMKEQGKKAIIFGSDGLFSPKDFHISGSYVSSFAPDINGISGAAEVAKAFSAKYGTFGTFGPPAYEAMTAALTALQAQCKAGDKPSREGTITQLHNVNLPNSILGQPIKFTPKGDLENAKFFIFKVNGTKFELVPPTS
jgi:branched-chain amino acid transport system substrate-binding protein